MLVFFYGLFMDEDLLAAKGIKPTSSDLGVVKGFALRLGQRATLVRDSSSHAYGVAMTISAREAAALYSDESVSDYVPETVTVSLADDRAIEATCYNLPSDQVAGTNRAYAESLLKLATRLGFPKPYLDQIQEAVAT